MQASRSSPSGHVVFSIGGRDLSMNVRAHWAREWSSACTVDPVDEYSKTEIRVKIHLLPPKRRMQSRTFAIPQD